jgi:hypothetical protein
MDDPSTQSGIAGLDMHVGPVAVPSMSMPMLVPRVTGGRVASFAHSQDTGRDPLNEGEGVEDNDNIDGWQEKDRKERLQKLRENQKPRLYGPSERILSDDVFRELIESNIRQFEEEHAHIDKHYSALGSRSSFVNVKCSPHAVQLISDAFEDFLMKLLRLAHVFFSARVRTTELLDDLTLKGNTFGPDHRMLINMRICNEGESKRKREHEMIESVQKQRDEEAAEQEDNVDADEMARLAAQRVEQKKESSKIMTMEEINRAREIMAARKNQGLLVKTEAMKAMESILSTVPLELDKIYRETEVFFKKYSEHPLSGQEVSNVHEIQAEIKKVALKSSKLRESEWRAFRLDDLVPVLDAEPALRRKMVTLYGQNSNVVVMLQICTKRKKISGIFSKNFAAESEALLKNRSKAESGWRMS